MTRTKLLRKRFTAIGFDALVLIIMSAVITIVCDIGLGWAKLDSPIWLILWAMQLGLLLVYVIDGGRRRATIGLRVSGLTYKAFSDGQLSQSRAMMRVIVGLLTLLVFPISMTVLMFTKRSLADLFCGTSVGEGSFEPIPRGFEPITRPVSKGGGMKRGRI
jgi:uncharacterized RDD family membrane protein YckC